MTRFNLTMVYLTGKVFVLCYLLLLSVCGLK